MSVVRSLSFRNPGSRPSTAATCWCFETTPGVSFHIELSTSARASRCRHPSLRMAWRLVHHPSFGLVLSLCAQRPPGRSDSRLGVVSRGEPKETQPLTPHVATSRRYGEPTPTHRRQSPFHQGLPKNPASRTRDAFHRQGLPRTTMLPRDHGNPARRLRSHGLAALVRHSTCFRAEALDPPASGYSPAETRHMPPIDFCNRYEPPTHLWISQTSISTVGNGSTLTGENSSPIERLELPCGRRTDRGFSAQGLRSTDTQRPSNATARSTDLPRPDRPEHLLSQTGTPRGLEGLTESPLR